MLALVGFRKLMDYFPGVFSQNDLFWLDNLMPANNKNSKSKKKSQKLKVASNNGTNEELEGLKKNEA